MELLLTMLARLFLHSHSSSAASWFIFPTYCFRMKHKIKNDHGNNQDDCNEVALFTPVVRHSKTIVAAEVEAS